jgi:hypothetical protein
MSYSYEINNTNNKKKSNQSKYLYTSNESDTMLFIFELVLSDKNNETKIIRKIKKTVQGNILSNDDNILYDSITNIIITILDINCSDLPIIFKETINHDISCNTILNEKIYIEIIKNINNMMTINYNINH